MRDRRSFLLSLGMIIGVPAANSSMPSAEAFSERLPEVQAPSPDRASDPVFRIHGWSPDHDDEIKANRAATSKAVSPHEPVHQVWIQISRSWRAVWC
jgi:hypothetical protein